MTAEKLTAVLVGCGNVTAAWLGPLKSFNDVKIIGLVDLDIDRAEKLKSMYELSDAVTETDFKHLIETRSPDIIFDCTPPECHADVTLTALRYGCHVLGEKPMAHNMDKATEMVETAKEVKTLYAVIQNRRYLNSIIDYRNLIQCGKIGQLTTLNADFYRGPHFGGFREQMDHVLLLDMAIHSFDQARFLSGTDPVSVYCHEWNPDGSWFKHGASAICIFEMTANVVFTYRGSWCANGLNTSWQCDWRSCGTEGTAVWDGNDKIQYAIVPQLDNCHDLPVTTELRHIGHGGVIRDFLDCVKSGRQPQTTCFDNIKSLAMVHAAIRSAEAGKKVTINI